MEKERINEIPAGEPRETDAAEGGVTRKAVSCSPEHHCREIFSVNLSGQMDRPEATVSGLKQKWD